MSYRFDLFKIYKVCSSYAAFVVRVKTSARPCKILNGIAFEVLFFGL